MPKKKNIYIGGSLFTDKQIAQRIKEEDMLKTLNNVKIYNPITNDDINDKTQNPTAEAIFIQDTIEVIMSDILIADLDDEDMGLAMEMGIAYACNYFLGMIKKAIDSDKTIKKLNEIIDSVPHKVIYATSSDIRQDADGENGIYKSWGQNQYVVGGIEAMGEIHRNFESVYKRLVKNEYIEEETKKALDKKRKEEAEKKMEESKVDTNELNTLEKNHTVDGVSHPYAELLNNPEQEVNCKNADEVDSMSSREVTTVIEDGEFDGETFF